MKKTEDIPYRADMFFGEKSFFYHSYLGVTGLVSNLSAIKQYTLFTMYLDTQDYSTTTIGNLHFT